MPVLESTDHRIAPKSILRHRPIEGSTAIKGPQKTVDPVAKRASRPVIRETVEDVPEWKSMTKIIAAPKRVLPNTSKSSSPSDIAKATRRISKLSAPCSKRSYVRRWFELQAHPLLYLGLGMLLMLVLWVMLSGALGWVKTTLDDVKYGRPRTYQTDAWVGHNEQTGFPSHFIAINLNRHIEIIEIAGGDPAHTHIYSGPQLYAAGDELVPVTLAFADLNGDHQPDMIVTFQGSRVIFINDHGGFRSMLASERAEVEHSLQHCCNR